MFPHLKVLCSLTFLEPNVCRALPLFSSLREGICVVSLDSHSYPLSSVARCEGVRHGDPKGNLSLKTFTWAPQMFTWAPQTNFPFELLWGATAMQQQENVCELTSKQMTVWCLFNHWCVMMEVKILLWARWLQRSWGLAQMKTWSQQSLSFMHLVLPFCELSPSHTP